jgi:hypothetical protein
MFLSFLGASSSLSSLSFTSSSSASSASLFSYVRRPAHPFVAFDEMLRHRAPVESVIRAGAARGAAAAGRPSRPARVPCVGSAAAALASLTRLPLRLYLFIVLHSVRCFPTGLSCLNIFWCYIYLLYLSTGIPVPPLLHISKNAFHPYSEIDFQLTFYHIL